MAVLPIVLSMVLALISLWLGLAKLADGIVCILCPLGAYMHMQLMKCLASAKIGH